LDQDALRKAAARRKKRAARNAAKPWDQPTPKRKANDADDEEDEDAIIDMTAHRYGGSAVYLAQPLASDTSNAPLCSLLFSLCPLSVPSLSSTAITVHASSVAAKPSKIKKYSGTLIVRRHKKDNWICVPNTTMNDEN